MAITGRIWIFDDDDINTDVIFPGKYTYKLLSDEEMAQSILNDPDEYRSVGAFMIPDIATWDYIRSHAVGDDIKVKLDDALQALEDAYPDKLKGLLPSMFVTQWDTLIESHEDEILQLTAVRDGLLPKLLSGEIRLKHAEKAVAGVV